MNNFMQMFNMYMNNPLYKQAETMLKGKSDKEIQEMVTNIAQQKGISTEQLKQMANQFGIKL